MRQIANPKVADTFASYPQEVRRRLLTLRELIFDVADETKGVGELEETLKWNEPAYLTSESTSGSTVRLGWKASDPDRYALHFICHTRLVEQFRTWYPKVLSYDGNRSIVFGMGDDVPVDAVKECVAAAFTYHRAKRRSPG